MDQLTRLLLDAQAGDREALERFVAATQHDVVALCRYLGDRDNADDLAQETFQRAIASLHRYRATGPAKHWLLTIARRTCADGARRRSRRRRNEQRVMSLARDERDESIPVGGVTELDELLLRLDPDRRAAFVLTQLNGLRYEEAARVLDIPIGTVRSRVARARADLVAAIRRAEADAADDGSSEPPDLRQRPYG